MAGLKRFVGVLRLFDEAKSEWTVPDMAEALGLPASTVYRTVRELIAEGFLDPATEARYRLGAAFVEFDRLVRLTDPLARLGEAPLADLAAQAGIPAVALLARLYGDTVMCVAAAGAGAPSVRTSYERGRPMPLLAGATSKAILAQLPTRRLARLIANATTPAAELRAMLAAIRKRGHSISRGEIDRGLVGLAVPLALPQLGLSASLSLVVEQARLDDDLEHRLVLLLVSSAGMLGERLRAGVPSLGPAAEAAR